jgi:prepilin-type N-terminal cleavage/methylation domain-containing protein
MKKRNNRGFTLVELLVSLAILMVLSAAVLGFVSSASSSYSSVFSNVNLQFESQVVMAQVQDYLVDCNGGLCFVSDGSGSTLTVVDRDDTGCAAHVFRFDAATHELYYSKRNISTDGGSPVMESGEEYFLSGRVTDFVVSLPHSESADAAELTLSFALRSKSYTGEQTVALRNRPLTAADTDALLAAVCT